MDERVEMRATNGEVATATQVSGVIIHAPHWFQRADFIAFLNGKANGQFGQKPATWYQGGEVSPEDYNDVFIMYDHGEGSDFESIPDDIWVQIEHACKEFGIEYGIVRISPDEVDL